MRQLLDLMENLSPNQPQSPPNPSPNPAPLPPLPTLPVSNHSQVFIHPEHEQGNLLIAKPKKTSKSLLLISGLGVTVLLAIIVVLFTYFIPRSEIVSYTKNIKDVITSSGEKLDKVNASLDILYKARTAQKEDIIVSEVLGVNTSDNLPNNSNIFKNTQKIIIEIKDNFVKNSKVKSYVVPASDPSFEVRKHRDLARDIAKDTTEASKVLQKITDLKNQTVPDSAKEVKETVSSLEENTNNYIDQAKKSSDYYIDVSDASIELLSLGSSINTIKDLDNTVSKLTALKSKFANYTDLPEEIDAYNKDLIEMFTLSASFISQIRDVVNSDYKDPMPNSELFYSQIQSLSNRSVTDEISFWQNNESLSSYDDLSKENTDLLQMSQKLKDANYFFFLRWLGVD